MPADVIPYKSWRSIPASVPALCILLVVVVLALYWPATGFEFSQFDDPRYYSDNGIVQAGLSLHGLSWAFSTEEAGNWHPLTWLSLMVDADLGAGQTDVSLPHLTNIVLHAISAMLLFLVLWRATGSRWRSFLVAGLFAVHPANVESVAWVAERKNVLCMFFMILALLAYVRFAEIKKISGGQPEDAQIDEKEGERSKLYADSYKKDGRAGGGKLLWLCVGAFALSLMSKPMAVTLPFVMLLLDFWPLGRLKISNFKFEVFRQLLVEKLPLFWLSAIFCWVTYRAQQHGEAVQTLGHFPLSGRIENAVVSYAQYLAKIFWPSDLAVFYPYPGHWPVAAWSGAAALLILASVGAARWQRARPFLLMGWCWFLGTLVPMIGLVQVGTQGMADRYAYLPMIGILIAVVWGTSDILVRITGKLRSAPYQAGYYRVAAFAAGTVILATSMAATRHQLGFWKNDRTLFSHALAVTRDNPVSETLLGNYYARSQQWDEAVRHYRLALANDPNYDLAHFDLGNALEHLGQAEEAVEEYRAGLRIDPNDPRYFKAAFNLAALLEKMGRQAEAVAEYERVLQLQPGFEPAKDRLQALKTISP